MSTGEIAQFDVVVIGAGLAGLRAALAAAEAGARTAIVCKSFLAAETASGMAGGGFVYPSKDLPPEEYLREVDRAGHDLNDRGLLALLARHGEAEFHDAVQRFGWKYVVRDRFQSTLIRGQVPGYRATLDVARAAVTAGVKPLEHHSAARLLVSGGRCRGCLTLDAQGEPHMLHARAVVLASGGFAGLFALNDNPCRTTGDGHVLALEAGCQLRDLEFIQFYPFGLDDNRLPHYMLGLPFPEGTRLVDEDEQDVLARHLPAGTTMYMAAKDYRDMMSIVILKERAAGHRPMVDFRHTDPGVWERFSGTRLLRCWGRDPAAGAVPVSPIAHFTMGGVMVDEDLQTNLPGLFACGEITGGVHGANRYAANALLACLVHGRLAGEAAARSVAGTALPLTEDGHDAYLLGPLGHAPANAPSLRRLRRKLGELCSCYLSPLRSAAALNDGIRALQTIGQEVGRLPAAGPLARSVIELRAGVKIATWAAQAALLREESRGAHFRDDFPRRDDGQWLRPILVSRVRNGAPDAGGGLAAEFVAGPQMETR